MSDCKIETARPAVRRSRRARRVRGAEIVEFTLVFLPLLAMLTLTADTAWAVFAKATLQRAVRVGVRYGVTMTITDTSGGCLTPAVKTIVQQNSLGLLNGSAGLAKIQVHYYQPPAEGSTAAVTDVSTLATGNQGGNIMEVSVQNFSLLALMPRITSWKSAADKNPLVITVTSADLIEPTHSPACIGTAP
jgi:Flp pilus assembly protein TadG